MGVWGTPLYHASKKRPGGVHRSDFREAIAKKNPRKIYRLLNLTRPGVLCGNNRDGADAKNNSRKMKKGQFTKAKVAAMIAMNDAGHSTREIGRELDCSPQTVAAYVSDASKYLADPAVKRLVDKYRDLEMDNLVLLRAKAHARLHEKLDRDELKPIELIALQDRSFQQSRLLEGKSTANLALRGIVKVQREALALTEKALSKTEVLTRKTNRTAGKRRRRPRRIRQRVATT